MIFTLFAAKLKQKWAKENKKNKFWTQKLELITKDPGLQFKKWIKNTHSDNFTINTELLTLTND